MGASYAVQIWVVEGKTLDPLMHRLSMKNSETNDIKLYLSVFTVR